MNGARDDRGATGMRRAAALTGAGLLVQLGCALHWTPIAFVLSAALGFPLVAAGALLFFLTVVRIMKAKGAL